MLSFFTKNIKSPNFYSYAIISITLLIISLFVFITYSIYSVTLIEAKRIHQRQQVELAKSASTGIKYYFDHLVRDINFIAARSNSFKEVNYHYNNQIEKEVVKSIFSVNESGELIYSIGKELPVWFQTEIEKLNNERLLKAADELCFYSSVLTFNNKPEGDSLFFLMVVKDFGRGSPVKNYLTGFVISFDWLMEKFIVPLKLSEEDFAWVLDDSGRLIYHPSHKEMLLRSINDLEESCIDCHKNFDVQNKMLLHGTSVDEYRIGDEPHKIMGYYPIELGENRWILAISTYLPAVIKNVQSNFVLFFIISGIIILLISVLGISLFVINLKRIRAEESEKYLEQTRTFQEKLNHAAKLASIGELVDTVAHEINTPAAIISAETDALLLHNCDPKHCFEELKIIKQQTRRIGNYTKSLLSYSRRMPFRPINNDLKELLDECLFLLSPRINSKKVDIELSISNNIPKFIFDRSRLEQVIINLINNAIDFTKSDPKIKIEAVIDKFEFNQKSNDYVLIKISDNGTGIPQANLDSIFEPFFSTKSLSKGTGLGLSISKAIVKRHNGHIEVQSELGKGTSFKIYLPLKNNYEYEAHE
ncbi:MAG: hypothetical protein KJ799_14070 [Bacteroidetes bacterium]|nr:hypothetical protein [Bacteroidota bacterium]MBU1680454.1 hypothetical protein [Bacteroidota bacterium]MBU2507831.1 hypothetical protein [Bacteroidota bacterium]